jgi:hypothetical protein
MRFCSSGLLIVTVKMRPERSNSKSSLALADAWVCISSPSGYWGGRHVWTAPADQGLFLKRSDNRGCSHVFGLLIRIFDPLALMLSASSLASSR